MVTKVLTVFFRAEKMFQETPEELSLWTVSGA
jgi:hypothetical protein